MSCEGILVILPLLSHLLRSHHIRFTIFFLFIILQTKHWTPLEIIIIIIIIIMDYINPLKMFVQILSDEM